VNSLTFIFNSFLPLTAMSIMNYVVYRTIHHRHIDDTESLSGGIGRRHFVSRCLGYQKLRIMVYKHL
jgi:hypothetical protein